MAGEETKLVLNVEARVSQVEKQLQRLRTQSVGDLAALDRAARNTSGGLDRFGRSLNGIDTRKARELREAFTGPAFKADTFNAATLGLNALRGGIAGLLGGASLSQIARLSDEWSNLGNKLRGAGLDGTQAAQAQRTIAGIAERSRNEIANVGDLYAKLTLASQSLGASQTDVAKVTETVSKALKLSGASAGEAAATVLQLGQALASGSLQGDELRSLLENAPGLSNAIAKSLGVTIGELRKLGSEGQLSADKVFGAILQAGPEIDAQFKTTTRTFSDWAVAASNAALTVVASVADALRQSEAYTRAVDEQREAMVRLRGVSVDPKAVAAPLPQGSAEIRQTEEELRNLQTTLRAAIGDLERFGAVGLRGDEKAELVRVLTAALEGDKDAADKATAALERLSATNPAAGSVLAGLQAITAQLGIVQRQAVNAASALSAVSGGDPGLRKGYDAKEYGAPKFMGGAAKAEEIANAEALANSFINAKLTESKLSDNARRVKDRAEALRKEMLAKGISGASADMLARQVIANEDKFGGSASTGGRSAEDQRAERIKSVVEALGAETREMQAQIATYGQSNAVKREAVELARLGLTATSAEGQAIAAAARAAGEAAQRYKELEEQQQAAKQASDFFGQTAFGALDGIVSRSMSAKDALAQMTRSIASAVLQAGLLGSGPLGGLFGKSGGILGLFTKGLFGGASSLGGGGFNPFSVTGSLFHSGGLVGATAGPARIVPASAFMHAPRFHGGLKADEMAAILQRGERVLTASQNARTENLITGMTAAVADGAGAGSGPSVVVHQHFEAGVSRQELAEILPKVKAAAEAGIVDKMRRGVIR